MKKKTAKLNGVRKHNLKKKLGDQCVYCGCNHKFMSTIDHIIPTARGGEDTDKNKQVCCFICNQLKGSLTHLEFKKYLKALNLLDELNRLVFMIDVPRVKLHTTSHPLTEEDIQREIKKDANCVEDENGN